MDIEGGMAGSINESMAFAVENACVVVPFMTAAYESSDNCKKELSYASDTRVSIVPAMAQPDYKQKGWLGLLTAGRLWIDFRTGKVQEALINHLVSEILAAAPHLKNTTNQTVALCEIPHCGNWVGFWVQQGQKGEMECDFAFDNDGLVTGKGSDVCGPFTWDGSYDFDHKTVSIIKSYETYQIKYQGTVQARKSISGKWHQVDYKSNNGTFELHLK